MRWKILRAPMMAVTMTERPGSVSTISAAPRAASVAPAQCTGSRWVAAAMQPRHFAQDAIQGDFKTLLTGYCGDSVPSTATPTSAFFRAGASLTPSPVMPTM